jgi:hypothetical protein
MEHSSSWEANSHLSSQERLPAFYWTRWFITVFTRARHWSLSWASCVQSTHSQPFFYFRCIVILSCHLRVGSPSGLFKILYAFLIASMRATWPAHLILDYRNTRDTWWSVQVTKLVIMLPSPSSPVGLYVLFSAMFFLLCVLVWTEWTAWNCRLACHLGLPADWHPPPPPVYVVCCENQWPGKSYLFMTGLGVLSPWGSVGGDCMCLTSYGCVTIIEQFVLL